MKPSMLLERSRYFAATFSRGAFDSIERTTFLFDTEVDCFTDGEFMFIKNTKNFESTFNYLGRLLACAEETVDCVLSAIPVHNAEQFRAACVTQTRFMAKLASISTKPYIADLSFERLRAVIEDHGLDIQISIIDGVEGLVFDPSRERRWKLLKLLDDDFLNSNLTDARYEVNSKQMSN
ncbi:MAG: DUF4868 domain-containing protein [Acidobacteria bacterium]|nr:DUF4868 domain-containing protein [Acidobacteriota bacterium]